MTYMEFQGSYLGDQIANVRKDTAGRQVHLPMCWFDQLLVQTKVFHSTLSSHTELIQVTVKHTEAIFGPNSV